MKIAKLKKICLNILLCVSLTAFMVTSAFAHDTIQKSNDTRITEMLDAIDRQNFDDAGITAKQAKEYVYHYLFDSEFAAIGSGKFKYPNTASNYFTYITDGTYSQNIYGAKGCMAYSRYISQVFYGTDEENKGQVKRFKNYGEQKTADELKEFLKLYAQAGAHLRINGRRVHSLSLISCNDNGFYVFSYSGGKDNDQGGAKINLQYYTYASFLNEWSGKIELYDANPSLNSAVPRCVHNYISLGVCDKCGQSYPYTVTKANFTVTTVAKANVQSEPYGHSAYYRSALSAGTTVAVVGTTKNHYGNTWYQIAEGKWICSDRCKIVSQKPTDQKPTITISGEVSPSGTLTRGKNFGLRGVVSTDCGKITSITGSILNSSGKTVSGQSSTYKPNATSVNIRTTINNDLIFDKLPVGSYTYCVVVTAKNGTESNTLTISRPFTVGAPAGTSYQKPTITISNEVSPSGTLTRGKNFGLRGVVSTNCGKITSITGSILNSSGKTVSGQSRTYKPNATSVNIRTTINNDLIFNTLPSGSYTYYVLVVAENGSESTTYSISRPFNVA